MFGRKKYHKQQTFTVFLNQSFHTILVQQFCLEYAPIQLLQ